METLKIFLLFLIVSIGLSCAIIMGNTGNKLSTSDVKVPSIPGKTLVPENQFNPIAFVKDSETPKNFRVAAIKPDSSRTVK